MTALDEEITKVKAALIRYERKLRTDFPTVHDDCCASCMYGRLYGELCDKAQRTEDWLSVLIKKQHERAPPACPGLVAE